MAEVFLWSVAFKMLCKAGMHWATYTEVNTYTKINTRKDKSVQGDQNQNLQEPRVRVHGIKYHSVLQ